MPDELNEEAEAVLRALGPQLEWRCVESEDLTDAEIAEAGHHAYSIDCGVNGEKQGETFHFVHLCKPIGDGNVQPFNCCYTHRADAKAACERHHATGKWD